MLLQALGSCHGKITRMGQKARNLFNISWVNFFSEHPVVLILSLLTFENLGNVGNHSHFPKISLCLLFTYIDPCMSNCNSPVMSTFHRDVGSRRSHPQNFPCPSWPLMRPACTPVIFSVHRLVKLRRGSKPSDVTFTEPGNTDTDTDTCSNNSRQQTRRTLMYEMAMHCK